MAQRTGTNRRRHVPRRRPNGQGSVWWSESRKRFIAEIEIDGKRHSRSARSEPDAYDALAQLQRLRSQEDDAHSDQQTLGQFLASWLQYKDRRGDLRDHSYRTMRRRVWYVVEEMGSMRLSAVRPTHIQRLYSTLLGKGLGPTTVHFTHSALKGALAHAVDLELIDRNPAARVQAPQPSDREVEAITDDELAALLDYSEGTRWFALWMVLGMMGLRIGEAMALRWGDVDWRRGLIAVERTATFDREGHLTVGPPKTRKSRRTVHMPALVKEALRSHRALIGGDGHTWGPSDLVFPRIHGGLLARQTVAQTLERHCMAAGVKRITPHQLRHTAATSHLSNGTPAPVVAEMLGHKSVKMTLDIYGHTSPAMHEQAMAQMDERVRQRRRKA